MLDPARVLAELDHERLAGTEGERKALAVLRRHLKALGLRARAEQFDMVGFDTGSATLEVGRSTFDVHPYGLEKTTAVEGELVYLENADVLAYNRGAYRDRVVLSYTSTKGMAQLLQENPVRAYIGISAPLRGNFSLSHRQKLHHDGRTVPSATVSYEDAEKLIAMAGKRARLRITQTVRRRQATNLVVSVGKPRRDSTLTYLVGHYDTVSRSHGSIDNAGGTVCLLMALEHFAQNPPDRELRVVFFSGEELGLLGSEAYVRAHEREVKERARLVVNVDLSGEVIGQDAFYIVGTRDLLGYVGGLAREAGLMFREALDVYSSDGMPFSVYEVPSVNIARAGGKGGHFIHTRDDTASNVSAAGLVSSFRAARTVLTRILEAEIYPVRREIDDSLREKIEKYLWRLRFEKPELKWAEKYRR